MIGVVWFTQHDGVVYSTTNLEANRMLVGPIVRKLAQQFQFVHVPTKEENVSSQLLGIGGGGGGTCYIYIRGVRMKDKIQTQKIGFTVKFCIQKYCEPAYLLPKNVGNNFISAINLIARNYF